MSFYIDPSVPSDPSNPSDPADPTRPSTPADPNVSPTSDESSIGCYFALAIISFVAITILLVIGRNAKGRYLRK